MKIIRMFIFFIVSSFVSILILHSFSLLGNTTGLSNYPCVETERNVRYYPFRQPKIGDMVAFYKDGYVAEKFLLGKKDNCYWFVGCSSTSLDSRVYGWACDVEILGVVNY